MASILQQLNDSIANWVKSNPLASPFRPTNEEAAKDAVEIMTLESGGNPFAVNDNTTGKSYNFTNYQDAYNYVTANKSHVMAIGLFQLLTHNGMGAAYSDNPAALLDPQTQFSVAIPQIISNATGPNLPMSQEQQFNKMLGNAWYADRGNMPKLTVQNVSATLQAIGDTKALEDAKQISGTVLSGSLSDAVSASNPFTNLSPSDLVPNGVSDVFSKIWNVNTLYIIGGSVGILLILVNIAKGGRD